MIDVLVKSLNCVLKELFYAAKLDFSSLIALNDVEAKLINLYHTL